MKKAPFMGAFFMLALKALTSDIGPAVWGFIEAKLFEVQVITVGVAVNRVEDAESNLSKVFNGRHAIENDCLVVRHAVQKINHLRVSGEGQEGVIPTVNNVLLGECLDLGKIHDHTVGGVAGLVDDFSGKSNLNRIAVTVQMATLAFMVGNAMSGIEFQATGDQHGDSSNWQRVIIQCSDADH